MTVPTPPPIAEPSEAEIEDMARAMQDWCENGTIHLLGHVPKTWEEDDPEWWIGLAEQGAAALTAGYAIRLPPLLAELERLRTALEEE